MAAGIQVLGKQAAIDMYEAYNLETWGLFQDKRPIIVGAGTEDLEVWLDRIAPAQSVAGYTLRLYDGYTPAEVSTNTDYRYCFNFKLHSDYGVLGGGYANSQLMQRIEGLEKKLEGSDSEADDLNSIIMGWLDRPEKLATIIGAVKNLLTNAPPPIAPALGAIGSVPTVSEPAGSTLLENEATLDRLSKVLDRLEKRDADILTHLEKLADIADKKPDTFKFLIGNLNGL